MDKGKELLSKIKFYDSYSKWNDTIQRKETYEESAEDVMRMHYNKFKNVKKLKPHLDFATESYKSQLVLASQRNLQYREAQILRSNARLFNCSSSYIDRPEVFKQIMFILLNGCGVGYSVERRFVNKLPALKERKEKTITHVIEDSIEGWALALDALMNSFFKGSEHIRFDGSNVRVEGAFISGGFKAPGYEPLRKSLELIEKLLQDKVKNGDFQLTSLDCHEIICISSDAVLAAGVRRSALIALFDKDDDLMLKCKTGDWFYKKPWLARANNTVKLLKNSLTKEEFDNYKESIKEFGEPGIALVDDIDFCTNPCCFRGDMKILTAYGYKTFKSLENQELPLINKNGYVVNGTVWCSGIKDIYKITTWDNKYWFCTDNHPFMTVEGEEVLAKDLVGRRVMPHYEINNEINEYVKLGFIQGDGVLGRLKSKSHLGLEVNIGEKDEDIRELFKIEEKIKTPYITGFNELLRVLKFNDSPLSERTLPHTFGEWSLENKLMFFKGMFSANGSVIKDTRISYKTTCKKLSEEIKDFLEFLGIKSYITTNKEKEVEFANGQYVCKESYDINIHQFEGVKLFAKYIGFVHKYKKEALENLILSKAPKVRSITYDSTDKVYDFNLQDDTHWGVVEGVIAHNCEIGFIPINPRTGKSCISFCNLNEINGGMCNSAEKFYEACRAAAIIGTLQASYTNMPFLGKDTEELIREEALLGVSITGIMENPEILLNPEILQNGAKIVLETNELIAELIGINVAARACCIKPSGNASVLLKTTSGCHRAKFRRGFRIMQMNKNNEMAKILEETNPCLLEESVWSAANSDYAVYIPIEEGENTIVEDESTDIEFLQAVSTIYKNWVLTGMRNRGYSGRITHNVSNTITVQDWDRVFDYIYDNQESFCGLSFMPQQGDKVYKQAPFTKVMNFEELVDEFGEGAMFASGLIVDALHAFDNDLWDACEASKDKSFKLSGDRYSVLLKKDIVRRIKKFAKNYFKNDLNRTVDCLKNIHVFHKFKTIKRELKPINFEEINMKPTYTDVNTMAGVSCSGGSCEITRI